jgi:hypothetical protein
MIRSNPARYCFLTTGTRVALAALITAVVTIEQ